MKAATSPRRERTWLLAYLVLLLAWAVWRASVLSITCDEGTTLRSHVPATWAEIFAHSCPVGSNNHLLNTVAIKLLLGFLPETELVVRLPALLGFVLYGTALLRGLGLAFRGPRFLLGGILLTAHPFVLDMMVLARGYALGLGLLAWAAVLGAESNRAGEGERTAWRPCLAAALGALAITANLSMLFGACAIGALTLLAALRRARAEGTRSAWRALVLATVAQGLAAGLVGAVYRPAVIEQIQVFVRDWGGTRGIWRDSIPSLVGTSLWETPRRLWINLGTLGLAVLLGTGTLAAVRDGLRRRALGTLFQASAFVWIVIGAASGLHVLRGVLYPLDRAVIVLVPGFVLILLALWEQAAGSERRIQAAGLAAIAAALLLLDVRALRVRETLLWPQDASTRLAMERVVERTRGRPAGSVRVGVWKPLWSAFEYYRVQLGATALEPLKPRIPRPGCELYYYMEAQADRVEELGLQVVERFPLGKTVLAAPGPGAPAEVEPKPRANRPRPARDRR